MKIWLVLGLMLVAGANGFLLGSNFDYRSSINWTAVGAVGSILVVILALVPIFSTYFERRRRNRILFDHIYNLLLSIEGVLRLKLADASEGTIKSYEAIPIRELVELSKELGMFDLSLGRKILVAAGHANMLVLINAPPDANKQQFEDAMAKVTSAISAVRERVKPNGK